MRIALTFLTVYFLFLQGFFAWNSCNRFYWIFQTQVFVPPDRHHPRVGRAKVVEKEPAKVAAEADTAKAAAEADTAKATTKDAAVETETPAKAGVKAETVETTTGTKKETAEKVSETKVKEAKTKEVNEGETAKADTAAPSDETTTTGDEDKELKEMFGKLLKKVLELEGKNVDDKTYKELGKELHEVVDTGRKGTDTRLRWRMIQINI